MTTETINALRESAKILVDAFHAVADKLTAASDSEWRYEADRDDLRALRDVFDLMRLPTDVDTATVRKAAENFASDFRLYANAIENLLEKAENERNRRRAAEEAERANSEPWTDERLREALAAIA